MPGTEVVFYRDDDGTAPAYVGLQGLLRQGKRKEPTSSAVEILDHLVGDGSELRAIMEEERVNAQVAREIYDLRTSRGLSQKQLADLVGTRQSAIARLEDADYEGHSLRMLRRIAGALDAHLSVHLVPDEGASTH